ncbi:1-acyl-sn-glycerol-3-phosphate acyltransferase [Burkholderiaceae bacterium DAT-1]|nr:1-acyl-sn-glycerol-3-phosphate acyltransferase [Burkholderiaceae bacterium DAT-1]
MIPHDVYADVSAEAQSELKSPFAPADLPMNANWFTQTVRLLRLTFHLVSGLLQVSLLFPRYDSVKRMNAVRKWSLNLLKINGIHVNVRGATPQARSSGILLVANHISWIDIFVMNAAYPSRFVAKSDVRHWPLIGWLSAHTGTLFIKREKRSDTARVNQQIAEALTIGDCISIFPEGSTSDGRNLLTFNSSLFQPAIDAETLIVPVSISYKYSDGRHGDHVAYIGDMTLIESILNIVSTKHTVAVVEFGEPVPTDRRPRREIAKILEQTVRAQLIRNQGA